MRKKGPTSSETGGPCAAGAAPETTSTAPRSAVSSPKLS